MAVGSHDRQTPAQSVLGPACLGLYRHEPNGAESGRRKATHRPGPGLPRLHRPGSARVRGGWWGVPSIPLQFLPAVPAVPAYQPPGGPRVRPFPHPSFLGGGHRSRTNPSQSCEHREAENEFLSDLGTQGFLVFWAKRKFLVSVTLTETQGASKNIFQQVKK